MALVWSGRHRAIRSVFDQVVAVSSSVRACRDHLTTLRNRELPRRSTAALPRIPWRTRRPLPCAKCLRSRRKMQLVTTTKTRPCPTTACRCRWRRSRTTALRPRARRSPTGSTTTPPSTRRTRRASSARSARSATSTSTTRATTSGSPTEFLAEDAARRYAQQRAGAGPVARLIERRPRGVLCCWAGFALFAALWIAFGWVDLSLADDMFRLEDDPHVYRHDAMLHLQPFTSGSQLNRYVAAARARRRALTPAAPTTCADDAERRRITLVYSSRSGGDGGGVLRPTGVRGGGGRGAAPAGCATRASATPRRRLRVRRSTPPSPTSGRRSTPRPAWRLAWCATENCLRRTRRARRRWRQRRRRRRGAGGGVREHGGRDRRAACRALVARCQRP